MFAMIGAVVFFGAAVFSTVVMVQMVRGYWPLMIAALEGKPMPRTTPPAPAAYAIRGGARRSMADQAFTPRRLAPYRAAA